MSDYPSVANEYIRRTYSRRKVFVSYHHAEDQGYYDYFSSTFCNTFQLAIDNSLGRKIGSEDCEYVMRRIREECLTGSTVTIVLCGKETHLRKYVDWEICASLSQRMGLIGIILPTCSLANGRFQLPQRLDSNRQSGYAQMIIWNMLMSNPLALNQHIQTSLIQSKQLIQNCLPTMKHNGSGNPSRW